MGSKIQNSGMSEGSKNPRGVTKTDLELRYGSTGIQDSKQTWNYYKVPHAGIQNSGKKQVCLNLESSKIQPGITRGPKTQQTWKYRGPAEIQNSEISGEPNNASNLNSYIELPQDPDSGITMGPIIQSSGFPMGFRNGRVAGTSGDKSSKHGFHK